MKTSAACLAVATLACVVGLERGAVACPPPLPGLYATLPAEGQVYPGNAALVFTGHQIGLEKLTVTVDGQPASLVESIGPFPYGLKALIEPIPAAGQVVVVTGDFCEAPIDCPPETLSFTASAADVVAPATPDTIVFDVHDHPDFMALPGLCQFDSDVAYWIDVEGTPAAVGEAPILYIVEALDDELSPDPLWSSYAIINASSTSFVRRAVLEELPGEEPPEAFCFRARALDTAGNASAGAILVCKPCHYVADPPGTSPNAPAEPAWTDLDLYPGGICDGGSSSSSTSTGTGGNGGAGGGAGTGGVGGAGGGATTSGAGGGAATSGAATSGVGGGAGGASAAGGNPADPGIAGGCGCRVAGPMDQGRVAWLLAALGVTIAARRARRARRASRR